MSWCISLISVRSQKELKFLNRWEYLKKFECDYVQGYVFYRPMPQAKYEALLDEQSV